MRKEIFIKIVIDGDKIGSIIQKTGFTESISSRFEIMGILNKVVSDEQLKMNNKLNIEQNYNIKQILDNEEDAI